MKQIDQELQEKNVALVRVIKRFPILYNMTHPDYSLKTSTNVAWDAVSLKTGFSGEL